VGFCVSVNGNIVSIQTPQGHEQIAVPGANIAEGYGICDTRPEGIAYNDWAWFATSNWGIPTLMSKTATSVEIGRITGDGLFILRQKISLVPSTSSLKIVMTLSNNSGTAAPVYLVRFADVSADGRFLNNLDSTKNRRGSVEHHREHQSLWTRSTKCRHAERFGLEWVRTKHLPAAELLCSLGELPGSASGWGQRVAGDGVRAIHTRQRVEDSHDDLQGFLGGPCSGPHEWARHLCL